MSQTHKNKPQFIKLKLTTSRKSFWRGYLLVDWLITYWSLDFEYMLIMYISACKCVCVWVWVCVFMIKIDSGAIILTYFTIVKITAIMKSPLKIWYDSDNGHHLLYFLKPQNDWTALMVVRNNFHGITHPLVYLWMHQSPFFQKIDCIKTLKMYNNQICSFLLLQ